jgi:hypothetical protein
MKLNLLANNRLAILVELVKINKIFLLIKSLRI